MRLDFTKMADKYIFELNLTHELSNKRIECERDRYRVKKNKHPPSKSARKNHLNYADSPCIL